MVVDGEGEGALEPTRSNRLVAGLEAALEVELGPRPASIGWRIGCTTGSRCRRGLGSSAAATVGGVVLGDALACAVGARPVPPLHLLQIATHDRVPSGQCRAVLLGGFVASAQLADRVEAIRLDPPTRRPRASCTSPTASSRRRRCAASCRAQVPLRRCRRESRPRRRRRGGSCRRPRRASSRDLTIDRLHEPYRASRTPSCPGSRWPRATRGALGAFLSGAGSTIFAFVAPGDDPSAVEAALRREADACGLAGRTAIVAPRNRGPEIRVA